MGQKLSREYLEQLDQTCLERLECRTFRLFVSLDGERLLKEKPEDTELIQRLLYAYQRIDRDDKARELYEILRELDPEAAGNVQWI